MNDDLLSCYWCRRGFVDAHERGLHERDHHRDLVLPEAVRRARRNAYQRKWASLNRDRRRIIKQRYAQAHPDLERERMRRFLESNPGYRSERHQRRKVSDPLYRARLDGYRQRDTDSGANAARFAVRYALRTGRLTRRPCSICTAKATEAHHYAGYEREHQLDVQWLCKRHHEAAHHGTAA